jgi:hypothetical protein
MPARLITKVNIKAEQLALVMKAGSGTPVVGAFAGHDTPALVIGWF